MTYKVLLLSGAVDDFEKLPADARERIASALRELEQFPIGRGVKKLKPPITGFRKRVGDYRILFDAARDIIYIHRIKHRKDAYRG